jgi:hypothetical protein
MKNLLITLLLMTGSLAFAGGSTSGTGLGSGKTQELDSQSLQDQIEGDSSTTGAPPAIENQIKGDAQVYYMGESETEVQFATNIKGSPKVNIKRMNPKVDFSDALFQGLKESQETGAWVELKKSNKLQIDNFVKEAGAGKFRGGGLNGIGGGARSGF